MVAQKLPSEGEELQQLGEWFLACRDRAAVVQLAAEWEVSPGTLYNHMSFHGFKRGHKHAEPIAEPTPRLCYADALAVLKAEAAAYRATLPPQEAHITIPTDAPIVLIDLADAHIGDPAVEYSQLDADTTVWAETPGVYVRFGGDMIQNAIKPNRGGHESGSIQLAYDFIRGLYGKLSGHVLAQGEGNHDAWTAEFAGITPLAEIAHGNRVLFTGASGDLHIHVGRQGYLGRVGHRFPGSSYLNDAHSHMRFLREHGRRPYRFIIGEHSHSPFCRPWMYDGCEVWLMRPSGYQLGGRFPVSLGLMPLSRVTTPALVFWPDRDRIMGFLDWREAVAYRDALC